MSETGIDVDYGDTLGGTLQDGLYIKTIPSSYSEGQISQYLTRIKYTPKDQTEEQSIENSRLDTSLENLERLIRLHHLTFPYENTVLHFTQHRSPDTDPQNLYSRFMYEHKASICTGHNMLFLHVLRGLRYRAYQVAARENVQRALNPTALSAISHFVILVQPFPGSNMTYLVDVGYGTLGPIQPMLLSVSENCITQGATPTEQFRLQRRLDPRSSLESRAVHPYTEHWKWALEVRPIDPQASSATSSWMPVYMFSEEEAYERDVANVSFSTRLHLDATPLVQKVLVENYVLLDENGSPILNVNQTAAKLTNTDVLKFGLGKAILKGGKLTLKYGGKSEVVAEVKTERERVALLREVFGIVITDQEISHIKGLPSALTMPDVKAKL